MSRDPEALAAALRSYLPGGEAVRAVVPLTTGFSNETYRIEGRDWILRMPQSAGAIVEGHDVLEQARLYAALGEIADGPPVPGVVAICEDASVLGAPFFVMECVAGQEVHDTQLPEWFTAPGDSFRRQLSEQWIRQVAAFASLPPLALLGDPVSPEQDARVWRAFADKAECPPLVAAYDRLLSRPAPISGPPSVVHGDVKLSNFMWHEGKLSAVLDWEMAINGEPLSDLGYLMIFFEGPFHRASTQLREPGILSRGETIALWEQVSGRSSEGVIWHEMAQIAKILCTMAEGTNLWVTGRSTDPKLAYFQQNLDYYLGVLVAMLDAEGL
ncbi:MAG: phosphotransferase family protein [Novosphingobium sp.]|nr:phosphotransferase family protein [Novosphingobium sp.]